MSGYRDIAADLRRRIQEGEFRATNGFLPKIGDLQRHYKVARQTVRSALKQLAEQGLIKQGQGRGVTAQVIDRDTVRIPLSRYGKVLAPGGERGPWETACAEQGLDGRMVLVQFDRVPADDVLAEAIGLPRGTELVYRRRHAMLGERIHHVQMVWYPAALVEGTGLAENTKVVGGAFGLLTALGHPPDMSDEMITARMPTAAEAAELEASTGVPLMVVERVVRDRAGTVLEFQRVIGPSDRIVLHYDQLPLGRK
ncbi:GntR family transcriptional regulator [Saccharothrix hoggarensis]|uniref:GntR family transcriptional regulator n=1 Tax=Saccharothrix hoggarensis TaxID=913853 RepID=A0ABW3QML2_9PSEU